MTDDVTLGNRRWLVGNPSRMAQISALWIGSAGLLVLGLQPILLGAMLTDARVSYDQLAIMATVEILAIGIGSVLAAFAISSQRLRLKTGLLMLVVAALNYWTAIAGDAVLLIVLRGVIGLFEGAMVAIAVELIARSVFPGRYGGYFVSMQTIAQSLTAVILSQWVVPVSGSKGGFIALAVITVLSIALVAVMPKEYGDIPKPEQGHTSSPMTGRPLLSLLSILFFYMFLGSLWAFLEPLGLQAGISAATIGMMVSASLGIQVLAALSATASEHRIDFRVPLAVCALIAVAVSMTLATAPGLIIFWCCTALVGFVWLFIVPFQIQLTVVCDASRKTALLVPAAQLFGAALGPVGATVFISGENFKPVAVFAAACAALSFVVLVVLVLIHRQATLVSQHS